ncbi:MAG: histidine phosphatase family protein [Candidatus Heimdallarchaeota archaeon]
MKIILVRHGQSTANKERIMQGHKDYPLSVQGFKEAEDLATKMKENGFTCQAVYSSDLLRAKQTAETITKILGLEVTKFDERLREMHLGYRQGKKVDEITIEEKELGEKIWKNHDINFPGGGENVNEMKSRVKDAFDEIVETHSEDDTVLIIAHGGTLYHVLYHILDIFPVTDDWFSNCSYNELIRTKKSEQWQLTMFNGEKL